MAAVLLVACNGPVEPAESACELETRGEELRVGLSASGDKLTFELTDVADLPAIVGMNDWTIQVTDNSGSPFELDLFVGTWMPDHSHSGFIEEVITPQGEGVYTVEGIHLFMAGFWEVTVSMVDPLSDAMEPYDEATFAFCVEG